MFSERKFWTLNYSRVVLREFQFQNCQLGLLNSFLPPISSVQPPRDLFDHRFEEAWRSSFLRLLTRLVPSPRAFRLSTAVVRFSESPTWWTRRGGGLQWIHRSPRVPEVREWPNSVIYRSPWVTEAFWLDNTVKRCRVLYVGFCLLALGGELFIRRNFVDFP